MRAAEAAAGLVQPVLQRREPNDEGRPAGTVEGFVQRRAGRAPGPHDPGLVGRGVTLGAGRFEGGDDVVEGVEGFSVVVVHTSLVTLIRIVGTPVSTNGIVGTSAVTLELGAGVESITLGAEPGSVGTARRFVSSEFAERGLEPTVAVLLTSELVSNVVRHANTQLTVALRFELCVRIEVHDGAAATEAFREILARANTTMPVESPGGRGLPLVRGLASRFGLSDDPGRWNGKVVWFELDPDALTLRPGADT